MPYTIAQTDLNELGKAMAEYYEEALADGFRERVANIAYNNNLMGALGGYLDQAKDTYANLKKTKSDKFKVTFKAKLKEKVNFYLANKHDVALDLLSLAEKAVSKLAENIPGVETVVSTIFDKAKEELHKRSIATADAQLTQNTGSELVKAFESDKDAEENIQKAVDQYKQVCKYLQTMPRKSPSTFDDAVTFPAAVFRVREAASHLNTALIQVGAYVDQMKDRLALVQDKLKDYRETLGKGMPAAVNEVLQNAYREAYQRGEVDVSRGKYAAQPQPPDSIKVIKGKWGATPPGGATQLAEYLANAVLQGYYDSGNRGPMIARPRSGAVVSAQTPFKR